MTRKKRDYTRKVLPDPRYHDVVISKTINKLMISGKRSVAEHALYTALETIGNKIGEAPLDVFHKALDNIKPIIEVRSRRVGGATYQVPTEVRPARAEALAIRWLVSYSNSRSERRLDERLSNELLDAFNNRGSSVKKREDTHKMAEANKAFAHFKW